MSLPRLVAGQPVEVGMDLGSGARWIRTLVLHADEGQSAFTCERAWGREAVSAMYAEECTTE